MALWGNIGSASNFGSKGVSSFVPVFWAATIEDKGLKA